MVKTVAFELKLLNINMFNLILMLKVFFLARTVSKGAILIYIAKFGLS